MALSPKQDSVISHAGHFKRNRSLSYATIAKADTFHFTVSKKSYSLVSPPILLEKLFKCQEAVKLMVVDMCFTKF